MTRNPDDALPPVLLPVLLIAGPTASGKSRLAVIIAQITGGEIVNADSMQVYSDIPILTAIPDAKEQGDIPHHGYGMIDGGERYSVVRWLAWARSCVAEIRERGKIPILVGGTGMYIRAALDGIAPVPDIPDEIRAKATTMLAEMGGVAFRRELARHDPDLAARLEDGDSQRLVRGMEVALATGKPLSHYQTAPHEGAIPGPVISVLVQPERAILYDRIDARLPAMVENGAVEEAARFMERGLDASLPLMKAVGLPPLMAWQRGEIDRKTAISDGCRDTRHLAKRQMTWFRHQLKPAETLTGSEDKQYMESFCAKILPKVSFRA